MLRWLSIFFLALLGNGLTGNGQVITTVAGNGLYGYSGDGGPATASKAGNPSYILRGNWCLPYGGFLFTDPLNNLIRIVDNEGFLYTYAGNGTAGYFGDWGLAVHAELNDPFGLADDYLGNVYVCDCINHCVRKIDPSGEITTVAGNGIDGYTGDWGPATLAELSSPCAIVVDQATLNIYFTDETNNCIKMIDVFGNISTIAGNPTIGGDYSGDGGLAVYALLNSPAGIAIDGSGNLFFADCWNFCVRKIDVTGVISTVAGNGVCGFYGDGMPATDAELSYPDGLAVDYSGNLYIADSYNNRVRVVNTSGIISTYAGNGTTGTLGDGGMATDAEFNNVIGVSIDDWGVLVTDYGSHCVRRIVPDKQPVFINGTVQNTNACSGVSLAIDSLLAFFDADSSQREVLFVTDLPRHGNLSRILRDTLISTGDTIFISPVTYTSDSGFSGLDTLCIQISDIMGGYQNAKLVFQINPFSEPAMIVGPDSLCSGSTVTLTATDTILGFWSVSNSLLSFSPTSDTIVVMGISPGSDTVIYTTSNFCGSTFSRYPVKVNPMPTSGVIVGPDSICLGDTVLLTDTVSGGLWSTRDSSFSIIGGIVAGSISGIDTIEYTVSNSCGTTNTQKIIAVLQQGYPGAISGVSTICAGNSGVLSDSVTGGIWSCRNGNLIVDSIGFITGVLPGPDTVVYSVTNFCGITSVSFPMTINPLPIAGILVGPDSLCVGTSVSVSASMPSGAWSVYNGTASVDASGTVVGIAVGIDTILYRVLNSCGTESTYHIVNVLKLPDLGNIGGQDSVCIGRQIMLFDTVGAGAWLLSNINANIDSEGTLTGAFAGSDTAIFIRNNFCGSDSIRESIFIKATPFAGTIQCPDSVCVSATITLVDSTFSGLLAGSNGNWVATTSGIVLTDSALTAVAAGTDSVLFIATNNCGSDTTGHKILVIAQSYAGVIHGPDSIVCVNTSVHLVDSDATSSSGIWYSGNNHASVADGLITGLSEGVDTISYIVANTCSSDTASFAIVIATPPPMPVISGNTFVCVGRQNDSLIAVPTGGAWTTTNLNASVTGGIVSATTTGQDTIVYVVSNFCGDSSASVVINIPDAWACDSVNSTGTVVATTPIRIYPNPTQGELFVEGFNIPGKVTLYDIWGRPIEYITMAIVNSFSPNYLKKISLVNLPPGLYILKLIDSNGSVSIHRIIKDARD